MNQIEPAAVSAAPKYLLETTKEVTGKTLVVRIDNAVIMQAKILLKILF